MKKLILALLLASIASKASADSLPYGTIEASNHCVYQYGFACDWDNYTKPVKVLFGFDREPTSAANDGIVWASIDRSADSYVGKYCGGDQGKTHNSNHGFYFAMPQSFLDRADVKSGAWHAIYAKVMSITSTGGFLTTTLSKNILNYETSSTGSRPIYVSCGIAPLILTQPANQTAMIDKPVSFSVSAVNSRNTAVVLTYQWQKNGVNIPGANAATYATTALAVDNGAKFRVIINNGVQPTTSQEASLSVEIAPGDKNPEGRLESADCSAFRGWACDRDNYGQSIQVQIYSDGQIGAGTLRGTAVANEARASNSAECSGVPNHGFSFPTPAALKDGKPHTIFAYAVNIGANSNPLLQSSRTVTCVDPNNVPSTGTLVGVSTTGFATGWAADPNDAAGAVTVKFYVDGAAGIGLLAGTAAANLGPAGQGGFAGNHGYQFSIPAQFRDGVLHTLHAYAADLGGGPDAMLLGSPKPFAVSGSTSSSDKTPPNVMIRNPKPGDIVSQNIPLTASANDDVAMAKVEFHLDGILLGTDTSDPYTMVWTSTGVADGVHELLAKAFDTAGNFAQHRTTFTVQNSLMRSWNVMPLAGDDLFYSPRNARIEIPAQAIPGTNVVTVTAEPEDRSDMGLEALKDASADAQNLTRAGSGLELGPGNVDFLLPVTLTMPVSPCDGKAGYIYYWNGLAQNWEQVTGASYDANTCLTRGALSHFSTYAVFAPPAPASSRGEGGLGEVYVFPNPADHGRRPTFHAEIPSAGGIQIRVYNVAGELVHTITLNDPPTSITRAGKTSTGYEYTWEYGGNGSGVYFYVVEALGSGGGKAKGKFVIVR